MTKTSKNELPVGRIAGLFGIRGELKCDPTSAGRTVFSQDAGFRTTINGRDETIRIDTIRDHKGRFLITLHGVENATAAERYVGATLYAARDRIELEPGEYLDVDLVGCAVVSVDGKAYGSVSRVEHYPASDMLVVGSNMVPMIKEFIRSIDIAAKNIVVEVPPGLLDENAEEA